METFWISKLYGDVYLRLAESNSRELQFFTWHKNKLPCLKKAYLATVLSKNNICFVKRKIDI